MRGAFVLTRRTANACTSSASRLTKQRGVTSWYERIEARPRTCVQWLQDAYLGFSVIRPLPGSPLGRTVVATFGPEEGSGRRREFGGSRKYAVHLGGFELHVDGLAFQQQDQGVSACATIALWSAIHRVAPMEGIPAMTPAQITEAASRYYLPGGRSLPSQGLTVNQMCEAIRAGGLARLA